MGLRGYGQTLNIFWANHFTKYLEDITWYCSNPDIYSIPDICPPVSGSLAGSGCWQTPTRPVTAGDRLPKLPARPRQISPPPTSVYIKESSWQNNWYLFTYIRTSSWQSHYDVCSHKKKSMWQIHGSDDVCSIHYSKS